MLVSDSCTMRNSAVAMGPVDLAGRREVELDLDRAALDEFPDLPGHRVAESEVVEHRRPQLGRDSLHGADRGLDLAPHAVHVAGRNPASVAHAAGQPGHLQVQAGQLLPELVVQLARDARALVLTHLLQRRRQLVQLPVRLAQLGLRALALGDVAQHRGELRLAVDRDLRDRRFDRKPAAVGAQPHHVHQRRHAARAHRGAARTPPGGGGAPARAASGISRSSGLPIASRRGQAEHALRGRVEHHDLLRRRPPRPPRPSSSRRCVRGGSPRRSAPA